MTTLLDNLADWLSGGELKALRSDMRAMRESRERWRTASCLTLSHNQALRSCLAQIAALETPKANATVRKMARIAREALK